jgi:hypothetical protein
LFCFFLVFNENLAKQEFWFISAAGGLGPTQPLVCNEGGGASLLGGRKEKLSGPYGVSKCGIILSCLVDGGTLHVSKRRDDDQSCQNLWQHGFVPVCKACLVFSF